MSRINATRIAIFEVRDAVVLAWLFIAGVLLLAGCNRPDAKTPTAKTANPAKQDSHAGHNMSADGNPRDKTAAHGDHPSTTKLAFATEPKELSAGQAAKWTLKITDAKTGEAIKDFALVHDKLLHLIIVSDDLSWFNHLHPEHHGDGVYTISATIPRAGSYRLYADFTPKGRTQQVAQHEFIVRGPDPLPQEAKLVADRREGTWIKKQIVSRPEGEPEGQAGAEYQVWLMSMPAKFVAGEEATLHFQIHDSAGKPIDNLQSYLGAMGHAVIISQDLKTYVHAHPAQHGDHAGHGAKAGTQPTAAANGPDVLFHTVFPTSGMYKAWGQFMHDGQIITASYVIDVQPGTKTPVNGHKH